MKTRLAESPFFNVMLFSILWALVVIITKAAFLAGAQLVVFTVQSYAAMLLALSLLLLPKGHGELLFLLRRDRRHLLDLIGINLIHTCLGTFLYIAGISLTSAVNAGFLVKLTLVFTVLLAWVFLKERLTGLKTATVILMLVGAYLLVTKGKPERINNGDFLIVAACLGWSITNVLIRKILRSRETSADLITLLRPYAALPVFGTLICLAPFYPEPLRTLFQVDLLDSGQSLYSSVNGVVSAFALIFLNRSLKVSTASYMSMMSMSTPLIVSLLAVLLLHEKLALIQVFGGGLILLGGLLTHVVKFEG